MLTICDVSFRASAFDVVQPNRRLYATANVAVTNKPSDASVYTVINHITISDAVDHIQCGSTVLHCANSQPLITKGPDGHLQCYIDNR